MPDIILNTTFTVPGLPTVPVYGFSDDFDRPDAATLGSTPQGKPWTLSGGAWRIIGGAAEPTAVSAGVTYPLVDALTADGTLTTTIAAIGTAAGGLAARYVDSSNMLRLAFRQSSGVNRLQLTSRVAGTLTAVGTSASGKLTATGSVIALTLAGTTATVKLNGETVITATVPTETASATLHGLYGADPASGLRWASASFTPA